MPTDQVISRTIAAALHREAVKKHGLLVHWVVEQGVPEHPGKFVARLVTDAPTPYVLTALSLAEMHCVLPCGLVCASRRSGDPPFLVETCFLSPAHPGCECWA
jgi:hypothetical protein